MKMMTNLKWGLIFLLAIIPAHAFGKETNKNVPPAVSAFVDGFIQDYNGKNFKAIYKDLSSGRFKASEDFSDFDNSMLNVFDYLGVAQKYEIDYLFQDSYNFGEFMFYRLQINVHHSKGDTVQRLVLMKRKNSRNLELDGYAIAVNGEFYVALGNLYNFDLKDLIGSEGTLWASEDFSMVWKDAKKDYLHSEDFRKKVKDNLKKSLWCILQGDIDEAVKLVNDPGDSKIESYAATERFSNGKIKWIVPYVNGKKNGETKFFYESGQLWQVVNYKNNLPHGDFTEFYPNGQIKLKSRYVNGLPVGKAEVFYEDGKIKAKFEFVFGQMLYKFKEFGEDDKLIEEGTVLLGEEIKSNESTKRYGSPESFGIIGH